MRPILDAGWFRFTLVMAVVWTIQMALVPDTTVSGVKADLLVVFVIAAAAARGPETGAICGFAVGLVYDTLLTTPFGLSALTYLAVGWIVGGSQQRMLRAAWWLPSMVAAVASAGSVLFFSVVGSLFDLVTPGVTQIARIALIVGSVNIVVAPIAHKSAGWIFANSARRAVL
jgi:rod shape-determining protein MreD